MFRMKYDNNITSGAKEVLRTKGITTTSYQTTLPFENGDFKVWSVATIKTAIFLVERPGGLYSHGGCGSCPDPHEFVP